ncbi:CDGSH iron-sulfur domain-containing protein [uncultured Kocuria sp.]|uniref:CDGSH iron-sulfur domain-containing protein n=1 Tax=uncultured Kocuria sp. TaxID=259305 RepID=UPI002615C1C4|nr:CDGSH iron-sulfur domain-containing protein [uncultured Kocuria sp.]
MSAEHGAGDPAPDPVPGPTAMPGPGAGSGEPVTITVCPDGPLLVRGGYELLDGDDRPIDPGRATVALCRCGASSIKPFCDGSHKRARFRAR